MKSPLITRQSFIIGGVATVALMGLGGITKYAWASERELLRPPGGQDEEHLISTCIRCDRCRQVCPMQVIESSEIEDGLINTRTPKLNLRGHAMVRVHGTTEYTHTEAGYCNFCDPDQEGGKTKKCIANCPTGALREFDETHECIGVAKIDSIYCLAFPQMGQTPTGCRICVDECPYDAIVMNDEQRPEVIIDKCNGCGKCELVCPSATYRQVIGVSTLKNKAESGSTQYVESLEYYQKTGKIPRGINIHHESTDTTTNG